MTLNEINLDLKQIQGEEKEGNILQIRCIKGTRNGENLRTPRLNVPRDLVSGEYEIIVFDDDEKILFQTNLVVQNHVKKQDAEKKNENPDASLRLTMMEREEARTKDFYSSMIELNNQSHNFIIETLKSEMKRQQLNHKNEIDLLRSERKDLISQASKNSLELDRGGSGADAIVNLVRDYAPAIMEYMKNNGGLTGE